MLFDSRPRITTSTALALVDRVRHHAEADGIAVAVVVTDGAGDVVASARMDGAPLGAYRLAGDKAYTAVLWEIPSGDLRLSSQPGGDDWGITSTECGRIVVYDGGVPVHRDNWLAGAVGVSGGTGAQDVAIARAAIADVIG